MAIPKEMRTHPNLTQSMAKHLSGLFQAPFESGGKSTQTTCPNLLHEGWVSCCGKRHVQEGGEEQSKEGKERTERRTKRKRRTWEKERKEPNERRRNMHLRSQNHRQSRGVGWRVSGNRMTHQLPAPNNRTNSGDSIGGNGNN